MSAESAMAGDCCNATRAEEQYHNVINSEHCCNWDRPIRHGSDVVVYREGDVRHCANNPDWDTHGTLRTVAPEDRKQFREQQITQWLETSVPRMRGESLCAYLRRCYAAAELELKQTKRMHLGDEYIHALDRFVFRLFMGCRLGPVFGNILPDLFMKVVALSFVKEKESVTLFIPLFNYPGQKEQTKQSVLQMEGSCNTKVLCQCLASLSCTTDPCSRCPAVLRI